MTSKPLPPHGTLYRYAGSKNGSWPPCRCPQCVTFHSRACKIRWVERVNGNPASLPAEPVADHIKALRAAGMTYQAIANQANVARGTVARAERGLTTTLHRDKARRILAVQPNNFDEAANQPATGTIRRIRALYAIGHGANAISAVSGIEPATVSSLANGYWPTVRGTTATGIRTAYTLLAKKPGSGAKAKARAASLGWPGPDDWDDDTIDDPNAGPPSEMNDRELAAYRRQEIAHLASFGTPSEDIAARLGLSAKYVQNQLRQLRAAA